MREDARTAEFWSGLAAAYSEAADQGLAVGDAVRDYLAAAGVEVTSQGTVHAHWIRQARQRGYLDPTSQGLSPNRQARLRAVASALEIDPERLRWAIREFANGKLSVN